MSSLKLHGVNKMYPSGTLALYDANLETTDKEFVVIVGAEESGKSTLLRVIAGLDDVSEGEIFIDGKDVTEVEPKDREIAMIFRNDTLYPALNVFDNMAFGLKMRKASPALIEQRVKAAANILGLTEILYRKPKTLTSAQRKRVEIGRAVVREPKLYILDEPLAGLDNNLKAELLHVIINLQARMEGTFLYATKNLNEAMTIGTRIVVMKHGTIQQIDTPANLYDYPANAYVAFYIGAPTINFVNNAKIVRTEEGVFAEDGDFKVKLAENVISRFENIGEYLDTDKRVILGIRPEDMKTVKGSGATVTKTESDGGDTYAECEYAGHTFVVKCENDRTAGACGVEIDLTRLYIFDAETRLTLLSRDEGYQKTGFADAEQKPLTFPEEEELIKTFKAKKAEKKKK
ncbi:MAG: ABC transporter ATP-binding protein [Clostridia bacterium]|nr:ABC transporter ATP-binding protein [Clostridia bacterium]